MIYNKIKVLLRLIKCPQSGCDNGYRTEYTKKYKSLYYQSVNHWYKPDICVYIHIFIYIYFLKFVDDP